MEGMQMMQSQILDVKKHKDVELVKSSVSELPRLPEWRAETAPLDLTDWFLTSEPAMGDLSDGSQQWWDGMVQAAKKWYALHQEKTPLEKVNHLESPEEAQGLQQAVGGLRRWLRWHRRAGEVGVVRPAATLQMKGLGRLMKKILRDNADLAFRIQLAKSSLQIDTTPTEASVMTVANHLLAEVEQIAHQDRKKKEEKPAAGEVKLKKLEDGGGSGGKGEGKAGRGEKAPADSLPGKMAAVRAKAAVGPMSLRIRKMTAEDVGHEDQRSTMHHSATGRRRPDEDDSQAMKGLLEEANKMLKTIQQGKKIEEDEGKEVRLQKLQKQLDKLKTLKVFRIAKVYAEAGDYGLLDSGATHALRGRRRGESLKDMAEVKVTLACDRDATLRMNQWGTMINQHEETEPIVPLGKLVNQLGCSVGWSEEGLEVALDIIQKLEERAGKMKKVKTKEEDEESWLRKLVEVYPVFKDLPQNVKRELVVMPSKDLTALPGMNRRRRRKIQKEGATIHLFAGEDEGYTLSQAVKGAGGDFQTPIELDVKRGEGRDMMKPLF
eukprot:s1049_g20.t1